jgi:hypothetical protein
VTPTQKPLLRLADIRTVGWQDFGRNQAATVASRRIPCQVCGYPADDPDDTAGWYVHLVAGSYLAPVLATVPDDSDLGWSRIHDEACVELVPFDYRSHVTLEDDPDAEPLDDDDEDDADDAEDDPEGDAAAEARRPGGSARAYEQIAEHWRTTPRSPAFGPARQENES